MRHRLSEAVSSLDPAVAARLADCRRRGTVERLPLHAIAERGDAEAILAAAVTALDGETCGHKIGSTSEEVQRLLKSTGPMHAPVLREHVLASGATVPVPAGLLGVECEFGFEMARDFPADGESVTLERLESAVADCFTGLEIIGRRVTEDIPLTEMSSLADYGLNVAVVRGGPIPDWRRRDLSALSVVAACDGATAASGTGAKVLGHPLAALLWLAEALSGAGGRLRAGEIVFTGSCTGITEVAPGQTFEGRFAELPPVQVTFD